MDDKEADKKGDGYEKLSQPGLVTDADANKKTKKNKLN